MKPSKYLERFKKMQAEGSDFFRLIGDALLVERVPFEEKKTSSGIILGTTKDTARSTMQQDAPAFVHVVAVGSGYYDDETGKEVDLDVKVGDIALVGLVSVKWFSMMDIGDYQPYEIGLCRENEIRLLFKGKEAYEQAFGLLAPAATAEVEPKDV